MTDGDETVQNSLDAHSLYREQVMNTARLCFSLVEIQWAFVNICTVVLPTHGGPVACQGTTRAKRTYYTGKDV